MSTDEQENKPFYHLDDLLPPKEAGVILHTATGTLANWRVKGSGPEYVKLGRIYYPYRCLLAYIENATRSSTSQKIGSAGRYIRASFSSEATQDKGASK